MIGRMKPAIAPQACNHPEHHVHEPAEYVREVGRVCIERGLRFDPLRERVLRLIGSAGKALNAYGLLDMMRE